MDGQTDGRLTLAKPHFAWHRAVIKRTLFTAPHDDIVAWQFFFENHSLSGSYKLLYKRCV